MWYEILPSFGIVVGAMAAPHIIAYGLNYVTIGNFFRRSLKENVDRRQYLRDNRLTGECYKISGLEAIPDQ